MKYERIEKIQEYLAYAITAGIFITDILCILTIADQTITEGVKIVLGMILGSLNTGWLMIITFYYGSSFGSVAKSKMLSDSLQNTDSDQEKTNEP